MPAAADYEYELRRDGAVIATGRIQLDEAPSPGDELALGSRRALVEDVLPLRGGKRLILEQAQELVQLGRELDVPDIDPQ